MKFILVSLAITLVAAPTILRAKDGSLVQARGPEDVARLLVTEPTTPARLIRQATVLGVAAPELIIAEALRLGATAAPMIRAGVRASPRSTDRIIAQAVAALGTTQASLEMVATAALTTLHEAALLSPLTEPEKTAETLEALAVLISLAPPGAAAEIADLVARLTPDREDTGATLLASLTALPEPAATAQAGFADAPDGALIVTPSSAAQDAPSAN